MEQTRTGALPTFYHLKLSMLHMITAKIPGNIHAVGLDFFSASNFLISTTSSSSDMLANLFCMGNFVPRKKNPTVMVRGYPTMSRSSGPCRDIEVFRERGGTAGVYGVESTAGTRQAETKLMHKAGTSETMLPPYLNADKREVIKPIS